MKSLKVTKQRQSKTKVLDSFKMMPRRKRKKMKRRKKRRRMKRKVMKRKAKKRKAMKRKTTKRRTRKTTKKKVMRRKKRKKMRKKVMPRKRRRKMTRKTTRKKTKKRKVMRRKMVRRRKKKKRKIRNQVKPLGKITMVAKKMNGKPLMETALSRLRIFTSMETTTSCMISLKKRTINFFNSVISKPACNSSNSKTDPDFG